MQVRLDGKIGANIFDQVLTSLEGVSSLKSITTDSDDLFRTRLLRRTLMSFV